LFLFKDFALDCERRELRAGGAMVQVEPYGGFARGRAKRDPEHARTLLSLVQQGWGKENPAFRQFFTSLFFPEGTPEQMQWFNDLQRITTSPEKAVRTMRATGEVDISDLLPQVRVPTLFLHCRNDAGVVLDEERRLAAGIPGAKFIALSPKRLGCARRRQE